MIATEQQFLVDRQVYIKQLLAAQEALEVVGGNGSDSSLGAVLQQPHPLEPVSCGPAIAPRVRPLVDPYGTYADQGAEEDLSDAMPIDMSQAMRDIVKATESSAEHFVLADGTTEHSLSPAPEAVGATDHSLVGPPPFRRGRSGTPTRKCTEGQAGGSTILIRSRSPQKRGTSLQRADSVPASPGRVVHESPNGSRQA